MNKFKQQINEEISYLEESRNIQFPNVDIDTLQGNYNVIRQQMIQSIRQTNPQLQNEAEKITDEYLALLTRIRDGQIGTVSRTQTRGSTQTQRQQTGQQQPSKFGNFIRGVGKGIQSAAQSINKVSGERGPLFP